MKTGLENLNNLSQRVIAGVIGALIMISGICYSEWSYFFLFFIICLLALKEFYQLIRETGIKAQTLLSLFYGMCIFTLIFLIEKGILDIRYYFSIIPLLFLFFLFELFRKHDTPFVNIAFSFLGIIYIAVPFAMLHAAAFYNGTYNFIIILGILLILWANDIGGYFIGRLMGKTKLFVRISPKKTWEGSFGGAFFSLGTAFALSVYSDSLSVLQWIVIAILIVIFGSYGDLIESLLKRSLAIKDSSQSIPGHGGFLDRFDGLLIAAPFIAAFLKLL